MKTCTLFGSSCSAVCIHGVDIAEVEKLLGPHPSAQARVLWNQFQRVISQIVKNGKVMFGQGQGHAGGHRTVREMLEMQRKFGARLLRIQADLRSLVVEARNPEIWAFHPSLTSLDDHRYMANARRFRPPNRALIVSVSAENEAPNPAERLTERIVIYTRAGRQKQISPVQPANPSQGKKHPAVHGSTQKRACRIVRPLERVPSMRRMQVTVR